MEICEIRQVLLNRLKAMGMEEVHIARLTKDIFWSFFLNPYSTTRQLNDRLRFLGWHDVELDYHTYCLAKESLQQL